MLPQPGKNGLAIALVHCALPAIMLGQDDRQFDHLFTFKFQRTDAVQDIRPGPGRGAEFNNRRGIDAPLHFTGQPGYRVMSLVHDHQRSDAGASSWRKSI